MVTVKKLNLPKGNVLIVLFAALVLIFIAADYYISGKIDRQSTDQFSHSTSYTNVVINGEEFAVEIVDSPAEMAKGLSGRTSIPDDQGMLFVFTPDTYTRFWMKGMLMPIDIIWINDDKILQIDRNVQPPKVGTPDSALKLYSPKVPVDYVLEVGANVSTELGFAVGNTVDLSQAVIN